ncbi:MAG: hypothetical protein F4X27_12880 [Chloroflexi bacterium]|nr:hypothetical protein [Chloroflexota bacterium]
MRLQTKAEAWRELRVSLSTLNRRIAAGEVPAKREPHGRRRRVYMKLADDETDGPDGPASAQAEVQEGMRRVGGASCLA